jgi:hypothetical protein
VGALQTLCTVTRTSRKNTTDKTIGMPLSGFLPRPPPGVLAASFGYGSAEGFVVKQGAYGLIEMRRLSLRQVIDFGFVLQACGNADSRTNDSTT